MAVQSDLSWDAWFYRTDEFKEDLKFIKAIFVDDPMLEELEDYDMEMPLRPARRTAFGEWGQTWTPWLEREEDPPVISRQPPNSPAPYNPPTVPSILD